MLAGDIKYINKQYTRQDSTFVSTKRCPKCVFPFDKYGGCNYMVCRCGFVFCWACLRTYIGHGQQCPDISENGRVVFELLDVETEAERALRNSSYSAAFHHRRSRTKVAVKERCQLAKAVLGRLSFRHKSKVIIPDLLLLVLFSLWTNMYVLHPILSISQHV